MEAFKMPVPVKITACSSTIAKSFVNGIVPCIDPTDEEIESALEVLGMTPATIACAYCGDRHTEWDHLNPLVRDKKPTGYISEIHNLVPSCGKCNQSKGNHDWLTWICSDAKKSPKSRGITDLEERIARLKDYEERFAPIRINFEELVGAEDWQDYMCNYDKITEALRIAEDSAERVRAKLRAHLNLNNGAKKSYRQRAGQRRGNDPLPIFLEPEGKAAFEACLLRYKKAIIEIHYSDGSIEDKPWNAQRFSETSDVYNNLRTRPEFRPGVWRERGIKHIVAKVIKG